MKIYYLKFSEQGADKFARVLAAYPSNVFALYGYLKEGFISSDVIVVVSCADAKGIDIIEGQFKMNIVKTLDADA
jgi:hypothetical protein